MLTILLIAGIITDAISTDRAVVDCFNPSSESLYPPVCSICSSVIKPSNLASFLSLAISSCSNPKIGINSLPNLSPNKLLARAVLSA